MNIWENIQPCLPESFTVVLSTDLFFSSPLVEGNHAHWFMVNPTTLNLCWLRPLYQSLEESFQIRQSCFQFSWMLLLKPFVASLVLFRWVYRPH